MDDMEKHSGKIYTILVTNHLSTRRPIPPTRWEGPSKKTVIRPSNIEITVNFIDGLLSITNLEHEGDGQSNNGGDNYYK